MWSIDHIMNLIYLLGYVLSLYNNIITTPRSIYKSNQTTNMHPLRNLRLTSGGQTRLFSIFKVLLSVKKPPFSFPPPAHNASPLKELQKQNIAIPKANKMPARPSIPETDISEKFIKGGSGKGGQKINKTNSKVQLTHIPTGLVVTSQATRSREQNRKIAREILALKIEEMEKGVESRAQIVIARKQMIKKRAKRKSKAKYKKLDSEKQNGEAHNDDETVVIVEDDFDDIADSSKQTKT